MARRRNAKKRGRVSKSVRVPKHSRSPRGTNAGKRRVSVKPHRRRNPDPSSYPRAMNRRGHKPTNASGRN